MFGNQIYFQIRFKLKTTINVKAENICLPLNFLLEINVFSVV